MYHGNHDDDKKSLIQVDYSCLTAKRIVFCVETCGMAFPPFLPFLSFL